MSNKQPRVGGESLIAPQDFNIKGVIEARGNGYSPATQFSDPYLIRGTNTVLVPSSELTTLTAPSAEAFDTLIKNTLEIEKHFTPAQVVSLKGCEVLAVTEEYLILNLVTSVLKPEADLVKKGSTWRRNPSNYEHGKKVVCISTPKIEHNPVAFRQFCTILKIPYDFSKKNPAFINTINFSYYIHRIDEPALFTLDNYEQKSISTVVEGEDKLYLCTPVLSILKGMPDIANYPYFSGILTGIKKITEEYGPAIQTYGLAYEGKSRGVHMARIILEKIPSITVKDEVYSIGLLVSTNFSNLDKSVPFGSTKIVPQIFREVCSNGMIAKIPLEHIETPEGEKLDTTLGFMTTQLASVPNKVLINSPESSSLDKLVKALALNTETVYNAYTSLATPFPAELFDLEAHDSIRDDFVDTVISSSRTHGFKAQQLISLMLVEFAAGFTSGEHIIKSPLDVVNWLTFTAKSKDGIYLANAEATATLIAEDLYKKFIDKKKDTETLSSFQSFQARVRQDLL